MAFSACRPVGQVASISQSRALLARPSGLRGLTDRLAGPAMARHARRRAMRSNKRMQRTPSSEIVQFGYSSIRPRVAQWGRHSPRPRMARISGRWGIRIDAARFATEKPDPHRPAASSNLRGQADGTWARFPGPKPASVMARHLARQARQTSYQLQARSRWAVWHRTPGHPTPPPRSRRNDERPQPNGRTPLGGARSAPLSHPRRIRTSGMP
jgi:hypothetical protein